jgi:hypothetical protein
MSVETKRPEREIGKSLGSGAEDSNGGAIPPLRHTLLWRGA